MKKANCFLIAVLAILLVFMAACNQPASNTGTTATAQQNSIEENVSANSGEAAEVGEATEVTKLNIWTWESFENAAGVNQDFQDVYPNVEVEFINVPDSDIPMKLQVTLSSGGEMPQLCWIEISQRGVVLNLDIWETLTDPPYNANPDDFLDFMMPVHSSPDGKWLTVEVSTPISGVTYKRDLLKQYLGTDDPYEYGKLIKSWDDMYDLGLKIKTESNGEVYLFGALRELSQIFMGQRAISFVVDGKLNLEDALGPVFDETLRFYNAGIVAPMNMWSPEWESSFNEKNVVFYVGPTWYPVWVIEAYGTETSGDWALGEAPGGGFLQGGTGVGIPSAANHKDIAWEYLKWVYLSRDGAISNRDHQGYLTAYAPAWREEGFLTNPSDFFAGQDLYKFYSENIAANMAPTRPLSKYDSEVLSAYSLAITSIIEVDGQITTKELLDAMREEIVNKVPELG